MLNKNLLKAYKENPKICDLVKYCHEQEMVYKDGILYTDTLKLKAELNSDSLWEVMVITNKGLMHIREFDKKHFVFKTVSTIGSEDKEFHLDISKAKNLTEMKKYFANEPILASYRSTDNGGRTNAELLSFLFQHFKKTLINDYRNKYDFLWKDTGCHSAIDLYRTIQIL